MGASNVAGMHPLHWAAAWGRLKSARHLIAAGADRTALAVHNKDPAGMAHTLEGVRRAPAGRAMRMRPMRPLRGRRATTVRPPRGHRATAT